MAQADPDVGIIQSRMISDVVNEQRCPRRVAAALLAFTGLVGLLLAGIGLYGVVSYSVTQGLKELGIRAALGADRRDIARLVIREGLTVAVCQDQCSVNPGLHRHPRDRQPRPADPVRRRVRTDDRAGSPRLVVLAASYFPARRAARVDPIVVLRVQ